MYNLQDRYNIWQIIHFEVIEKAILFHCCDIIVTCVIETVKVIIGADFIFSMILT